MPYAGDDYLKLLDLTAEGQPQKYNEMLRDYHRLISEQHPLVDYARLSADEVRRHLASVRERLIEALGVLPHGDSTPPELLRAGGFRREGYTVEKLCFETMPDRPVTALLYSPEPRPASPVPGVLIVHGHGAQGKAQPATQMRSIGLVKRGFVVLAVDTAGLGERKPVGHANFAMFATGTTLQATLAYDNMRALDLLCSLPEVDGSQIGCTGSSGGGTQTLYLAALDARVTAAAPTAAINAYKDHSTHSSSYYCQCEVTPGMVRFGDIGDILALIAPRAVLVLAGTRDRTFPVKGARESFLRALDAYARLGCPDRIEKHEFYAPHAYSRSMRGAMYAFMERHLMGRDEHAPEDFPAAYEDPAGDEIGVLKDGRLGGKKVFPGEDLDALTCRLAREALDDPEHPARRTKDIEEFRAHYAEVRPKLMGDPLLAPGYPQVLRREERAFGSAKADCFLLETECGILVPALVASGPKSRTDAPLVFYLVKEGKDAVFFHRRARELLDAGFRVAGIDVRGTGETCYVYHTEEEYAVLNAAATGRAVLDGRALDLAAFIDALRDAGYSLEGSGLWVGDSFSLYGVLAAVDRPDVGKVVLESCILSLVSKGGFSNEKAHLFVPGIVKELDLPQLFGMLSPRPLMILNPADGRGAPLDESEARKALAWTEEVYEKGAFSFHAELPGAEARAEVLAFFEAGVPGRCS